MESRFRVRVILVEGDGLWLPGGGADDRSGQQLRVPKGVTEAVGTDGVLPVPGVADQGPARAPRLAHVAG